MKKTFALQLIFSFCLVGCTTQKQYAKNKVIIPYMMPNDITQTLSEAISDKKESYLFFTLSRNKRGDFSICIKDTRNFKNLNWTKNSNRHLLLNGKYFPLIFDYDDIFANSLSGKNLLIELEKEQPIINRVIQIIEHQECYEFNK